MPPEAQARALILAGAAGGALRVASSFVPYAPQSVALEALYAVIDVGMLLGLVGVHMQTAARTGVAGFVFFSLSLAALASIVGPDATMFGVDFYRVGASLFALALAGYAATLMFARVQHVAATLWILCAVSGLVAVTGSSPAFMAAGITLGLGYVATLRPLPAIAQSQV